jgi:hypothetical protein
LHRSVVAEKLLDGHGDKGGIAPQTVELVGVKQ